MRAGVDGVLVASCVLTLYVYWFAIANRYIVFLYYHPMGPRISDTSPFSQVTSSRYWMAGLVASGGMLILYAAVNWAMGRLLRTYFAPAWWRVWLIAAVMLAVGIPTITMGTGNPVLPPLQAAKTALSAIAGIGLACALGELAARRPRELLWLTHDGLGLTLVLQLGSAFYFPLTSAGLSQAGALRMLPLAGLLAATSWLFLTTWVQHRRRLDAPSARVMLAAGLAFSYLVMPLIHHVAFTDGYYYITSGDNFFYRPWWRQAGGWLLAAGLAVSTIRVRTRLASSWPQSCAEPGA